MSLKINSAWSAVSAILQDNFTFYDIKQIVGLSGFNKGKIAHLEQIQGGVGASKGQLISGIDGEFSEFNIEKKGHFLNIVVEEILERKPDTIDGLNKYLSRLGWAVENGAVIPVAIFDVSDLPALHKKAKNDLIKSAQRYRDGDLSGALSSACAAVDNVTSHIYKKHNLGDSGKASFQERCKVAMKQVGIFKEVEKQLKDIDWIESGITPFNKNFEGSLNQAANVMQTLRANMSDVHRTKPVLKPLVFDSIKWAEILVRVLSK